MNAIAQVKIGNVRMKNRTAEDAAADWMDAKNEETKANAKRIEIENELIGFLGAKLEGSKSHEVGPYKVTIEGKLNRKIDLVAYDKLNIPAEFAPIKTKREPDVTGIKYLEKNEPAIYKQLETTLTIEPAKTSVTVIRTEK